MKTLEQLGISPAPWRVVAENPWSTLCNVVTDNNRLVSFSIPADAHLVAAAPRMYSAGRDLLTALEEWIRLYPPSEWSTMGQRFQLLEEAQDELRSALAEAAGEGVRDGDQ